MLPSMYLGKIFIAIDVPINRFSLTLLKLLSWEKKRIPWGIKLTYRSSLEVFRINYLHYLLN